MVSQVFLNHFLRKFPGGYAEISPRPKVPTPVTLLYHWKFLEYLPRNTSFDAPHDVRGGNVRWSRYENMDMIFADYTPQNLNFKALARLANQLTHPDGKVALKDVVTVLGDPNEMVLNLKLGMTPMAVIHTSDYTQTACRMLPA